MKLNQDAWDTGRCPVCAGERRVDLHDDANGQTHIIPNPDGEGPCPACDGSGR